MSGNTVQLRSTQPLAISMTRERMAHKNRGIIAAPCGFGKSVVACAFIEAATKKNSKTWFVVDRQNLVRQMSDHLKSYGIDHGVMMAGHEDWDMNKRVQVVSIQTAEKRGWDADIDLMIVDEAHANLRQSFLNYVKQFPKTKIVGITATPFHKEIGKAYDFVVSPTTTNKQIEEGFLVPLKIYQCVEADMTGAKTSGGEWTDDEVRSRGRVILGDIVQTWIKKTHDFFGKPVKTIIFPSTIAHGQEIADAFRDAGYNFKVVSCKDTSEDKVDTIADFKGENSQYDGLISCGVLTRGFDVTDIQIGIMARPFRKSFSEYIQQIGRVQRSHTWSDGTVKQFGLLLDHAGNVARFKDEMMELFENGVDSLADPPDAKPPRKEPTAKEKEALFCPQCKQLWTSKGDTCTCGYVRKRASGVETAPGQMVEVVLTGEIVSKGKKLADSSLNLYQQLCTYHRSHGNPASAKGRAYHQYHRIMGKYPPNTWRFDEMPNVPVSVHVSNKIHSLRIAYAKSQQKHAA